ncbi:MAG: aldo/keto reductase [Christensenellaceae bacterium]|nr:aldo/keto reductase [Christensenellaceae bacterium]
MQYRTDAKSGNQVSILGYGCMRFPRSRGQIDYEKAEKLLLSAVQNGVNYFDTAYLYGGSEEAVGAIFHKHNLRKDIYLATKLPHAKCQSYEDFERLFQVQLTRLQTDYIDYYLIHNLADRAGWQRLCALGIEKWIAEKKASGQVRQIGFSFHGAQEEFLALLDMYDWEFCQIQYNYMNVNYQAGQAGLRRAAAKGLPVIIMEPLLGGKLAAGLPKKALQHLKAAGGGASPARWALRWLWDQPEVTVVLSGMSAQAQLDENLDIANTALPNMLTGQEKAVFAPVVDAFKEAYKVPCTGCNYCMPCPNKVNIPGCFAAYNMSYAGGFVLGMQQYLTSTGGLDPNNSFGARRCVQCGKCETQCPQHIAITRSLQAVSRRMEPKWVRPLVKLALKLRG